LIFYYFNKFILKRQSVIKLNKCVFLSINNTQTDRIISIQHESVVKNNGKQQTEQPAEQTERSAEQTEQPAEQPAEQTERSAEQTEQSAE